MDTNAMCNDQYCQHLQREFLELIERELNKYEVKMLFAKLQNHHELTLDSGFTLLHYAATCGNEKVVQHLIDEGCIINAQDASGDTPLMMAIYASASLIVEVLLKNGADIYLIDHSGQSIFEIPFKMLCFSFLEGSPLVILKMLFDRIHADYMNDKVIQFLSNANYITKLAMITFGKVEIVKFILETGFNINSQETKFGYTALHHAILLKGLESVKILINFGASIGILDNRGRTPLRYYTKAFEDVDENSEVLRCFLKCFANLPDPREGDIECLLKKGKKKTVVTVLLSEIGEIKRIVESIKQKESLLKLLIQNENSEVLDVFTEFKIRLNVNHVSSDGRTALIIATRLGRPKSVQFLLEHGADVNLMPCGGRPAIMHTECHGEVIELLLQYGADAQYYFNEMPIDFRSTPTKTILAQLAILGAREQPSLNILTLLKIKSNLQMFHYFELCKKQLEELKNIKINDKVTLFELLTYKEEKLLIYIRNPEIISEFKRTMDNFPNDESCYLNKLKLRVSKLLALVELQEKAALAITQLTGLCSDVYRHIIFKIISYLSCQDLNYLRDIGNDLPRL